MSRITVGVEPGTSPFRDSVCGGQFCVLIGRGQLVLTLNLGRTPY